MGDMWENNYLSLVDGVIQGGFIANSRAGITRSLPGQSLTIPLDRGFPLLLSRKIFYKGVFGELAGFVRGASDLRIYKDFGCNYWDANAAAWPPNQDKPEEEWSIGRSYGAIWRNLSGVDQLKDLLEGLKKDPYSRRHVVSAWDPSAEACLPSCHIMWQCYVRDGGLHVVVYMRSVDLCVGLPSDIVLYAMLANLIAKDCNLVPMSLTFFFGDCHVYENHVETFFNEQRDRTVFYSYHYPSLVIHPYNTTLNFLPWKVEVVDYNPYPAIGYQFNA